MAIDRFYAVEAVIRVPLDHEFPEEVRNQTFLRLKGDTTTSDLILEEIRQLLEKAGLPIQTLSVGLKDWRVTDEKTGELIREIPNDIPPKTFGG